MLLSVSAPVLLSIKKSDLCRWLYSKYCFSHINFVRFSTWIFSDFAGENQKGNRNIFHICSSSFWLSTKKSVWCFPMLQNISFSGISFWWLTWDTEPRARDTCRSPQIQQADQLCNVQWITLQVTFMHKWAKEKKKIKPQNSSRTCRNSACAERSNSMWKLPDIVDLFDIVDLYWY